MQLQPQTEPEFIRAPQAAAFLGIPLRSFHSYVARGELPSYKLGRHRLFRTTDLRIAVEATRVATKAEVLR